MTLAVDNETVSKTLWPPRPRAHAPLQSDGQLLRIHAARPHDTHFTCSAGSPIDESSFAIGTSNGSVYGLSLRENSLFLVARTGLSVRCLSFCGGVAFQTLAVALEGNVVVFCDWGSGRVLQRFQVMAHDRPITSIVVSPMAPTLTILLSADKITCWTPVATSMDTSNYQYTCIGGTSPSQVLYYLLPANQDNTAVATPPAPVTQEAPRFLTVHLLDPYLLTVETNGVVSLWSHERRSRAGGGPSALHETIQLQCALRAPPEFVAHCSAVSATYLALGDRHAPVVAIMRHSHAPTFTLESLLLVRVAEVAPSTRSRTQGGDGHGDSPSATAGLSVADVGFIGSELLVVLLSNHRLVFVAMRTRTIAFHVSLPTPERTVLHKSSKTLTTGVSPYRVLLNGSTFALAQGEADAYIFHLPTAKKYVDQRSFYEAVDRGVQGSSACVHSGGVLSCATDRFDTVKVASFLRQARQNGHGGVGSATQNTADPRDVDAQQRGLRAAARNLALCSGRDPSQRLDPAVAKSWVDASVADGIGSSSGGARTAAAARRRQLQQTANALYSDALSPQAVQYNTEKLRAYVQQYGLFPSTFRPVIWRFALGLPEAHVTAPQYAALSRRPQHVCVEELMEGFALPAGAMRQLVEKVLSNLAWHSPVFAMGHFLPALVFPLCHVYPQDPQRITEAVLSFFNNWFREFFSHYPSRPAHLATFLVHVLQKTNNALYEHLETIGAGADVWGWSLMKSFYTDVLSSAEWLQVMDHAVLLNPMWLFHFHLCLVDALSGPLLACQSATEVQSRVLQKPHPSGVSIPDIIAAAYAAYHTHKTASPVLKCYYTFRDFGAQFEYPVDFPCDMAVVREKIQQLDELAQLRHIEQEAETQLLRDKTAADTNSLNQEMAMEAQRVRMVAKYDAAADIWRRRVLLEKTREELEARQRVLHLHSVNDTVQHAEALQRLEEETADIYRQLGHSRVDQGREEFKWDMAARLTDQELTRLEREAQSHMARSLQRLSESEMMRQDAQEALFDAVSSPPPPQPAPTTTATHSEPADLPADTLSNGPKDTYPVVVAATDSPRSPPADLPREEMPYAFAAQDTNVSPPRANAQEAPPVTRFIDPNAMTPPHADPSLSSRVEPLLEQQEYHISTEPRDEIPFEEPVRGSQPPMLSTLRVQTPPREVLDPYRAPSAAAKASAQLASVRHHAVGAVPTTSSSRPPSALQQLYERMKRAAAASVTTSSSAYSSSHERPEEGHAWTQPPHAACSSGPSREALHDNLDTPRESRGFQGVTAPGRQWVAESDSSTLTTTSLGSGSPLASYSHHSDSTYSAAQVLEAPRERNVREYTY